MPPCSAGGDEGCAYTVPGGDHSALAPSPAGAGAGAETLEMDAAEWTLSFVAALARTLALGPGTETMSPDDEGYLVD